MVSVEREKRANRHTCSIEGSASNDWPTDGADRPGPHLRFCGALIISTPSRNKILKGLEEKATWWTQLEELNASVDS